MAMSAEEWGTLQEPTLPAPDLEEPSEPEARAARSGETNEDLLTDTTYVDNDHKSVEYMGQEWQLPGGGEPGDSCQIWKPVSVCNQCAHVDLAQEHCDRWECPHCEGGVMARFSVNAATRIQSFRYTQPKDHRRQWAHAVVSPPDGDIETRRDLFESRSKAADIAMQKGFRGCAVVAHSHRASDLGKQLYQKDVERDDEGNPVVGFWVWLRANPEYPTEALIEWSPHFHVIGVTSPGMAEGTEADEWKYHVIRFNEYNLDGVANSRKSHRELYTTFRYLASHILQPEDCERQRVTWHGALANSVFVEDAKEDWQYGKPSDGAISAIRRRMDDIAEEAIERDDGDESGDSDDVGDCPVGDCGGDLISAWDINDFLDQANPPPDVVETMRVVRDWVGGEIELPPGLRNPRREADAKLALEKLVPSYSKHKVRSGSKQVENINPQSEADFDDPPKPQEESGNGCPQLQFSPPRTE